MLRESLNADVARLQAQVASLSQTIEAQSRENRFGLGASEMTQSEFTLESRRDAHASIDTCARRAEIMAIAKSGWSFTADELAERLGRAPYVVRPRLTELCKSGLIKPVGRQLGRSGTKITLWALA